MFADSRVYRDIVSRIILNIFWSVYFGGNLASFQVAIEVETLEKINWNNFPLRIQNKGARKAAETAAQSQRCIRHGYCQDTYDAMVVG